VRIFLSHSSHAPDSAGRTEAQRLADEADSKVALQRVLDVAAALREKEYEVLVDKGCIRAGDRWRRFIHEALAECDAAAIFVSDWSLASSWVRYEATVLAERATQDAGFMLLPIVLPGTDTKKLRSGDWAPLELREIQAPATGDAREIADVIAGLVGDPTPATSRLDRLREDIAVELEQIDWRILERACEKFGADMPWRLHTDRRRALADILARRVLRDGSDGVAAAVRILKALVPHLRQSPGKIIVEALEPLWVTQSVASALEIAASKGRPLFRDVALNGWMITDFTAEQYLRRARPPTDWELASVADTTPPARVKHVRQELHTWLRTTLPGYANAKDDTVERKLAGLDALFVLLPFVPDGDEMDALRAAYPKATFVCGIAGAPPDPVDLPEGVVLLEPPLESQEIEERALSEVSDARRFVAKLPP
jgi:hypothetical protein